MNTEELLATALSDVVNDLMEGQHFADAGVVEQHAPDIIAAVRRRMNDNQVVFYQP